MFFRIFLITFLLIFSNAIQAATIGRIVAVVNEDPITLYELETAMSHNRAVFKKIQETELAKQYKDERDFAIQRLIEEKLLTQELKRRSIEVNDTDVENTVQNILKRNNLTEAQFEKKLREEGFSLESYKVDLRRQIARMKLIGQVIGPKAQVNDADLEEFFARNPEKFGKFQTIEMAQIIIPLDANASDADLAKAQNLAREVAAKASRGGDFVALGKKYSSNPLTAEKQTYSTAELAPQMVEILSDLKEGQVSEPVRTNLGLHIIKLFSRETLGGEAFKAVRDQLKEKVQESKVQEELQKFIEELKVKSDIEVRT